jgi:UDP-3-O-[3-hydroxymyristoyl] glucosamine N-acyltransferase
MKMNCVQENYILAKATWQAAKEVQLEKYNYFMAMKGISMDDVTDENFEALSAEYGIFAKAEIENTAMAWTNLEAAENALIAFGISIGPASIRETLSIRNKLVL